MADLHAPWHVAYRGVGERWEVHRAGEGECFGGHNGPCGGVIWDGFRETVDEDTARLIAAAPDMLAAAEAAIAKARGEQVPA